MYIGIDVGGTNLCAGLVDKNGNLSSIVKKPLDFQGPELFARDLAELSKQALKAGNLTAADIEYVGMGIPGAVQKGTVLYTANIPMKDVPLETLFRQHLDIPVLLGNDADCAAVAEFFNGAGKGSQNFIVITLGTGVGGGILVNGKLLTGMGCGGEVGHMVIRQNGVACNCGRKGCFEAYASATGLIRMTKEAMAIHPESALHKVAAENNGVVEGKTPYQAAGMGDKVALEVCREYVDCLAEGMANLVNIFHPEIIAIGGGVAGAPENLLLNPLREEVNQRSFCRHTGKYPKIVRAELGNDAGIVGAALLGKVL